MDVQIMSGALCVSDKTDAGVRAIYGCRVGQNLPSLEKNTPNKPVIFHQLLVLKGGFIPYLLCPHWHAELDSRVSSLTLGVLSLSRGASPSLSPSQHPPPLLFQGTTQPPSLPPATHPHPSALPSPHFAHKPPTSFQQDCCLGRANAWEEPRILTQGKIPNVLAMKACLALQQQEFQAASQPSLALSSQWLLHL